MTAATSTSVFVSSRMAAAMNGIDSAWWIESIRRDILRILQITCVRLFVLLH